MSSITSAASRWPLVASSSRLAASRRRADAGSYTISGGAGGATRTASARRTHSRASINDGRGARRGGDGQHQGADRLKAPQPDAGDSTEEQAGQRTPDAGRDGSAGGCARPNFCDSGSPTAISTNTGAGVLAARRAKCAASESTASHASHHQLVEIVIRDAAGFRANSADHRAKPARGSGRPSSIHRDPLVDPTVTNHRAACHGTGLGRHLGHAMDSGSIKDVSRLELDVHGRSRMKLPEIAFRLSHLNGNPDRAGVAGPMIGVVG